MTIDPDISFLHVDTTDIGASSDKSNLPSPPAEECDTCQADAIRQAPSKGSKPALCSADAGHHKAQLATAIDPSVQVKVIKPIPLSLIRPRSHTAIHSETAAPQIDFITTYGQYADVLEAPRIMHEVVGMQLVATVLNRNGVLIQLWGNSDSAKFLGMPFKRQWLWPEHASRDGGAPP